MKIAQKQKSLFLFLFLFGHLVNFANENTVDSFVVALQSYPHSKFEKPYARLLSQTGDAHFYEEEYSNSSKYYFQSLKVSQSLQYDSLSFYCLHQLGESYFWQSEYDSSLVYFHRALDFKSSSFSKTIKDSTSIYRGFGNTYYYMGQLEKAYKSRMKVLEINRGTGNVKAIADSYYELAELDKEQKKFREAKEKVNKALELYLSFNAMDDAGYCYDLLSNISYELKDYNKALDYLNLACSSKFGLNSQYHQGFCAYSLGLIHMKMKDYDLALDYYIVALKIQIESKQKEESIRTKIALAELKMLMGECFQAKSIVEQCLKDPIINKVPPLRQDIYEKAYEVNFECGNHKVAYELKEKFYNVRDSIKGANSQKELTNLSYIFELNQKKQELELLRKDKELTKLYYGLISIAFIILIVIVGVGSWFYKKMYHYNTTLEVQKNQIEEQNKALSNSNKKLKIANEELENFAYIASHDLKGPLRTVISYTGLIEKRYKNVLDENGVEFLKLVSEGVSQMHQLLDDVLTYSNVEKGELNLVPIDLNKVLDKVTQTLQVKIEESEAIIKYEKLPMILGNQMQIIQVFQNIIANAIKFIPEGVRPFVNISVSEKEGKHCIAVRDNGIGIERKFQERIFSLFKRLHSSQEFKGTGLGLSICKKIIERHGGKIWLESDGKSGSTFYFTLKPAEVKKPEMVN